MNKRGCCLFCLIAVLGGTLAGAPERPQLTVWLMPAEPTPAEAPPTQSIETEVEAFNQRYGADCPVTVLNTALKSRHQLVAWNPEFAVPNWPVIKSQRRTLRVLERFAETKRAHLLVRFVNWSAAFDELQAAFRSDRHQIAEIPDVAQIGTTWLAALAHGGGIRGFPPAAGQSLLLHTMGDPPAAAVRYTVDVRLFFHWKRLPNESPRLDPIRIDSSSWDRIVQSLSSEMHRDPSRGLPPIVMPVGMTLNLLHDYASLVWSGGADFAASATHVNLTGPQALKTSLLLARNAIVSDAGGRPYRLFAFPEMSHQEATRHFLRGDYLAIVEPVAFLKRWQAAFRESAQPGHAAGFWNYAAVETGPAPFKGGSDLVIGARTPRIKLSEDLVRFLSTDPEHTAMLGELGQLPAQAKDLGLDQMFRSMASDLPRPDHTRPMADELKNCRATILEAVRRGRQHPDSPMWPTGVENRDVLEALQRLWRRIGEGNQDNGAEVRVREAAATVQNMINRQIDPTTRAVAAFIEWWPLLATGLLAATAAILVSVARRNQSEREKTRALQERQGALDRLRKIQTMASVALLTIDSAHKTFHNPFRTHHELNTKDSQKAIVIASVLEGWLRGRDERNWRRKRLVTVIWEAVLAALESLRWPGLSREYHASREADPELTIHNFLVDRRLIQSEDGFDEESRPCWIEVSCDEKFEVATPLPLEQSLVCLLQNAITQTEIHPGRRITISFDNARRVLSVGNPGVLAPPLVDALHASTAEEFQRRIRQLLRGNPKCRPGIGLVQAFCITSECFGGLMVESNEKEAATRISVNLAAAVKEIDR